MTSYTPRKRGGSRHGGHVVVTGDVSYDSVSSFLHEFYGPRQGLVDMDVVVLADEQPSRHLAALLRQAQYQRRVSYLFGSLLHEKDAARARVDSATAVFVLATAQPTRHASTADASTILHAIAVDRVTLHARQRSDAMRCFIQLLAPRPPRCLRQITGVEVALNTPRVRAAILARNVVCPGATALVLNLLSSAKDSELALRPLRRCGSQSTATDCSTSSSRSFCRVRSTASCGTTQSSGSTPSAFTLFRYTVLHGWKCGRWTYCMCARQL
ncbi:hypothetical protein PINS_up017458 [Pythium insidiosum]|nr:hypothetical protein PINS_up017458 [Pythium insidiosum]